MNLSREDIVEIIRLFEQSKFDICQLEIGDLKLTLSNEPRSGPHAESAVGAPNTHRQPQDSAQPEPARPRPPWPAVASAARPENAEAAGLVPVRAPVIGTFYQAPEPGAKRFVDVGSTVAEDTTVGLIEVMKVFNAVSAGVRGRVERIEVDNEQFVEFGQILFLVRPE